MDPDSFRLNSEEDEGNCQNTTQSQVSNPQFNSLNYSISCAKSAKSSSKSKNMYWSTKVGNIESIKLQQILYKLLLKKQGIKEKHTGR